MRMEDQIGSEGDPLERNALNAPAFLALINAEVRDSVEGQRLREQAGNGSLMPSAKALAYEPLAQCVSAATGQNRTLRHIHPECYASVAVASAFLTAPALQSLALSLENRFSNTQLNCLLQALQHSAPALTALTLNLPFSAECSQGLSSDQLIAAVVSALQERTTHSVLTSVCLRLNYVEPEAEWVEQTLRAWLQAQSDGRCVPLRSLTLQLPAFRSSIHCCLFDTLHHNSHLTSIDLDFCERSDGAYKLIVSSQPSRMAQSLARLLQPKAGSALQRVKVPLTDLQCSAEDVAVVLRAACHNTTLHLLEINSLRYPYVPSSPSLTEAFHQLQTTNHTLIECSAADKVWLSANRVRLRFSNSSFLYLYFYLFSHISVNSVSLTDLFVQRIKRRVELNWMHICVLVAFCRANAPIVARSAPHLVLSIRPLLVQHVMVHLLGREVCDHAPAMCIALPLV